MPRLVIKEGPGVGRDHALGGAACIVGRDGTADFVLDDTIVSRRHVRFSAEGGAWYAEDLGSTNGTLVNGKRAQRARLRDGDLIRVGNTFLTFVQKDMLGGPPSAAAAQPRREGAPAPVRRRRKLR